MVFRTLVLQVHLRNEQKKNEDDTFLRNKKEKQNIATIMKSVNGKRNSFSNEAEITRESFE